MIYMLLTGYQNILLRLTGHASLTVLRKDDGEKTVSSNDYCVRYALYSLLFTQRVAANHLFLVEHLPVSNSCYKCITV